MKHYYTCPLKAAWMAKYFGMKIGWSSEDGWQIAHLIHRSIENKPTDMKLYIHEDSLYLLEPQVGDFWINPEPDSNDKILDSWHIGRFVDVPKNMSDMFPQLVLISRNGIPFMWPEIEI